MTSNAVHRTGYFARCLTNPFAAYTTGFLLALSVYSLGFSDLYPRLQRSLVLFLLATCVASALLACVAGNITNVRQYGRESLVTHIGIFLAIMGVFAVQVIANGGIPLLLIAASTGFNYMDFGIPTIYVAFVGFCYFYAVFWFDLYLLGRGKSFLVLAMAAFSTSLLILSRGQFIITLVAFTFVYVQRRGLDRKLLLGVVALVGACLWGFAFLGNLRAQGTSGESIILTVGEASDSFLNSDIPTELFWPYLYASSPLANLQLNVTNRVAPTDRSVTLLWSFFQISYRRGLFRRTI